MRCYTIDIIKISESLMNKLVRKSTLAIAIVFFLVSLLFSCLHYTNILYGNNVMWISWILAVVTFSFSFFRSIPAQNIKKLVYNKTSLLILFIIVLYWFSHLWNFSSAPWNQYGLFDDAAWDIYYAKNHIFTNAPFQAAFFDEVGYISREVVFHYYISIFFKLFGYNLLVFNLSLLFLGFVTVFFTSLLVYRLFNNIWLAVLTAVIINFFPLHYMHIFMGHRYAIAAPLMIVSLYFLYTAFIHKSFFRATLSSFFAALCWSSAIMGKQYLASLVLAVIFILIFGKKRWRSKQNITITFVWIAGFFISAVPLLVYVFFNYNLYTLREQGLLQIFYSQYQTGGLLEIKPYFDGIIELFFAKHTYSRQFLPGFSIIPFSYYILIIPGLVIALLKRRFELIFLSFIPVIGTFVSGSYDFRVLLAVPIWVVCIAMTIHALTPYMKSHRPLMMKNIIAGGIVFLIIILGLIPSIVYIWNVSKDPNYLYLLPHKDVAVSRLVQDIVAGTVNPTITMKYDELNRNSDISNVSYDVLVCPFSAYAIIHLYLQNYDDKKMLSFCNQGIQLLKTPSEIIDNNIQALLDYRPHGKDLKLIWEVSDKSAESINLFRSYKKYGTEETISDIIDERSFSLYVLTIKKENIKRLQQEIVYKKLPPQQLSPVL